MANVFIQKSMVNGLEKKKEIILLSLLALAVAFLFQGSLGLYETTEGRYAESSREMLETGNWLVPQLDNQPHLTKPPLTYWAIAAGIKLCGRNEFGVRFGSAVTFFLIVLFVSSLGNVLWDKRTGYIAGVLYATAPFPVFGANFVSTDIFLALWELLAVLCYWKALRNQNDAHAKRWIIAMWAFYGLGFLTKGPPALLPLVPILVFHFQRKRTGLRVPQITVPLGIALFGVLGFSWYVYISLRYGGTLDLFVDEVILRMFSSKFNRNPQWYRVVTIYLVPLVIGLGAWLFFLPGILKKYRHIINFTWLRRNLLVNRPAFFLFLWLVIPIVILSISRSRLPFYVLPFFPALILALARGLVTTYENTKLLKTMLVIALIMMSVFVSSKKLSADLPYDRNMKHLYDVVRREDTGKIKVLLFNERKMFGLKFYMNGSLERVSGSPRAPWADRDLETLLKEIKDKPGYRKYVFIVKNKKITSLQNALDFAGLFCSVNTEARGYTLLII